MNNQETIQRIQNESNNIIESLGERSICEFKIKDLDIDNGFYLNEMPVRGRELSTIM